MHFLMPNSESKQRNVQEYDKDATKLANVIRKNVRHSQYADAVNTGGQRNKQKRESYETGLPS